MCKVLFILKLKQLDLFKWDTSENKYWIWNEKKGGGGKFKTKIIFTCKIIPKRVPVLKTEYVKYPFFVLANLLIPMPTQNPTFRLLTHF